MNDPGLEVSGATLWLQHWYFPTKTFNRIKSICSHTDVVAQCKDGYGSDWMVLVGVAKLVMYFCLTLGSLSSPVYNVTFEARSGISPVKLMNGMALASLSW